MSLQPQRVALSVILPAYNEATRILPYLNEITTYLHHRAMGYELIVVDDGSLDSTAALVQTSAIQIPTIRLLRLPRNMGKGYAVRTGILAAGGDLRLVADADGATPIRELEGLESSLNTGADLAIGSRFLASRDPRYRVTARWHRTVLGNLFNMTVQRLGLEHITDTQCGFKLFRGHVAQDLFSVAFINGYGFDLEVLYIAQRRGYRLAEVPVNWADKPGTKVRVLRDGLCMLQELLSVRRYYAAGRYTPLPRMAVLGQPHASAAPPSFS